MPTKITIDQVLEIVRSSRTRIDVVALTPSALLRDIGADSLDMMSILLDVQTLAGIEIPDSDIVDLRSVDAIVEYVNKIVS